MSEVTTLESISFVSSCQPDICKNGGTCLDLNVTGQFNCTCPSGYGGENCDAVLIDQSSSPVALIAGILLAFVLIICLLIAAYFIVRKAKEKRRQHGTYSPSREERTGRRIELNQVLKPPPIERLI